MDFEEDDWPLRCVSWIWAVFAFDAAFTAVFAAAAAGLLFSLALSGYSVSITHHLKATVRRIIDRRPGVDVRTLVDVVINDLKRSNIIPDGILDEF
jgi:hypothetical protein